LTEVAKLFNLHGADVVEAAADETENTDEQVTAA